MILPYVSPCQLTIFGGPPAVWLRSLERNTPQKLEVIHCVRGVVSPVLANIYQHYALDLWFERAVRPQQQGRCRMIRYADDFVACFEYRHEAEAFDKGLKERLAKFGLEVAADKTKTLRFGHNGGPHNGRFDFLGFEFYWELDRQGKPRVKRRTATKKWRAGIQRMTEWVMGIVFL